MLTTALSTRNAYILCTLFHIPSYLNLICTFFQWVGPIEDYEAEFDSIDANGGGQILFNEFVDWATDKNLDIEDDDD